MFMWIPLFPNCGGLVYAGERAVDTTNVLKTSPGSEPEKGRVDGSLVIQLLLNWNRTMMSSVNKYSICNFLK